jgi:hypothetical protein
MGWRNQSSSSRGNSAERGLKATKRSGLDRMINGDEVHSHSNQNSVLQQIGQVERDFFINDSDED